MFHENQTKTLWEQAAIMGVDQKSVRKEAKSSARENVRCKYKNTLLVRD